MMRAEPNAYLQKPGNPAFDPDLAAGRHSHVGEDLEQGAFSRPVRADDAEDFVGRQSRNWESRKLKLGTLLSA